MIKVRSTAESPLKSIIHRIYNLPFKVCLRFEYHTKCLHSRKDNVRLIVALKVCGGRGFLVGFDGVEDFVRLPIIKGERPILLQFIKQFPPTSEHLASDQYFLSGLDNEKHFCLF